MERLLRKVSQPGQCASLIQQLSTRDREYSVSFLCTTCMYVLHQLILYSKYVSQSTFWFCTILNKLETSAVYTPCMGIPGGQITSVLPVSSVHSPPILHYFSLFEGYEYYLSDSSGLPITTDGKIVVYNRDGTCETHTWTLKNWLNVSGIRYQSRTKLYCVQKVVRKYTTALSVYFKTLLCSESCA